MRGTQDHKLWTRPLFLLLTRTHNIRNVAMKASGTIYGFVLFLALGLQASGGPLTISLHGGPSTNDVYYRINGATAPYRQVEEVFSSLSRIDRLASINIFADETVCFGSVANIVRRLRDFDLGNYVLISGSPDALTVIVGDECDLNDLTRRHYDRSRSAMPEADAVTNAIGRVTNQLPRAVGSNTAPRAVRVPEAAAATRESVRRTQGEPEGTKTLTNPHPGIR